MAEASVFVRNNGKRVNIVAHTDGVCGAHDVLLGICIHLEQLRMAGTHAAVPKGELAAVIAPSQRTSYMQ